MADVVYIDKLYEGVEAWNEWRRANPSEKPMLVGEDLSEMDLTGVNLSEADLTEAELFQADLSEANLKMAVMTKADLAGANLTGAALYKADLGGACLIEVNLTGASLGAANLRGADLRGTKLRGVDFDGTDLSDANLSEADLTGVVTFDKVLVVSGDTGTTIGKPHVDGASVVGTVLGVSQGPKLVVQHFRRRKNSRRKTGHRQLYTKVKIEKISG